MEISLFATFHANITYSFRVTNFTSLSILMCFHISIFQTIRVQHGVDFTEQCLPHIDFAHYCVDK
jgi:hypothetical protein